MSINVEILLNDTIQENNMTNKLILVRGLPSSGKTTFAKMLEESMDHCIAIAADDWHYTEDGVYNWKPDNVKTAHQWCHDAVEFHMKHDDNIVVHNTFTTEKEMQPYFKLAEDYDYEVTTLIIEKRHTHKNNHNVPQEVVDNMEKRLRKSIKLQ